MEQIIVGNPGKLLQSIRIVINNRLLGPIRAGHYQGGKVVPQQQIVQRGSREHDAEIIVGRGDCRCDRIPRSLAQQHDRPLRTSEEKLLCPVYQGKSFSFLNRFNH